VAWDLGDGLAMKDVEAFMALMEFPQMHVGRLVGGKMSRKSFCLSEMSVRSLGQ
jgi:hypothetical protein